jgi:predicted ester cyclase
MKINKFYDLSIAILSLLHKEYASQNSMRSGLLNAGIILFEIIIILLNISKLDLPISLLKPVNMQNKDFMLRWYNELWNQDNESIIDELMHPHVKAYGLGPGPLVGVDAFRQFYKTFRNEFADIHVTIDKSISEDDYEVSLCTVTAKHKQSGKPVNITGTSVVQLKNGQLLNGWNHFDFLTLNLQIGKITEEQLR